MKRSSSKDLNKTAIGFKVSSYGATKSQTRTVVASLEDMFKMPNALSLNVGDFFAETSTKKLWYLPKKSLTDGIRECLAAQGELDQNALLKYSFQSRLSGSSSTHAHSDFDHVAFFVTSGFEHLIELSQAKPFHPFSRHFKKATWLHRADTTFGIDERVDARSQVVKKIEKSDLEFISSKLELLSIQTLAVGFLHSNLNPGNEKFVADFFKMKGFDVFCSHEQSANLLEAQRWQQTLRATRKHYREKQIATELSQLQLEYKNLKIDLASDSETKFEPFEAKLHLGLESFVLSDSNGSFELSLSPTSLISSGFFNTPDFSNVDSSFDPGPMIMGKAFAPCLIDYLFATQLLSPLENLGINSVSADRAKPRILESILALVRNNQERKHIDIQKELSNIEKILAYRIWCECLRFSNFKKLKVVGPLSSQSLIKILKAWRPSGTEVSTHE